MKPNQQTNQRFLSQSIDFNYKMLVSACKFTTLYLLKKYNQRQYLFEDPLERRYKVKIDKQVTCSCHQGNLGHCIHSLYILIRIYKISEDHPFVYKKFFTQQDLIQLDELGKKFKNVSNKKQKLGNNNQEVLKLKQEMMSSKLIDDAKQQPKCQQFSSKILINKQQKQWPIFQPDTVCSICYDQIQNQTPIIDCLNCKNYFHTKCLKVWVNQKQKQNTSSSCPMCRSDFETNIDNRIIKMNNYYVEYHQSHGIACSSCKKDILIKLYKCLLCQQIYLCSQCYYKWQHKNHDKFICKQGKKADWSVSQRSQFNINKLNANLQFARKNGGKNMQFKQLMGQKYQQFLSNYIKKPSLIEHIINSLTDVEKQIHKTYKKLDFVEKDIICCVCRKKKIVGMRRLTCKHFIDQKCLKFILENGGRQCLVDKKYILPGLAGVTLKVQ